MPRARVSLSTRVSCFLVFLGSTARKREYAIANVISFIAFLFRYFYFYFFFVVFFSPFFRFLFFFLPFFFVVAAQPTSENKRPYNLVLSAIPFLLHGLLVTRQRGTALRGGVVGGWLFPFTPLYPASFVNTRRAETTRLRAKKVSRISGFVLLAPWKSLHETQFKKLVRCRRLRSARLFLKILNLL